MIYFCNKYIKFTVLFKNLSKNKAKKKLLEDNDNDEKKLLCCVVKVILYTPQTSYKFYTILKHIIFYA